MAKLSHVDSDGKARMVDVSGKKETEREAVASGQGNHGCRDLRAHTRGRDPRETFTVAKIAGIMAAKKTYDLIPLCHPLAIAHVDVDFRFDDAGHTVEIISTVRTKGQTGVEMEALTSATVAGPHDLRHYVQGRGQGYRARALLSPRRAGKSGNSCQEKRHPGEGEHERNDHLRQCQ